MLLGLGTVAHTLVMRASDASPDKAVHDVALETLAGCYGLTWQGR